MRSLSFLLALLLTSSLVTRASQPASEGHSASTLTIQDIGPGAVPIDGDWQFHLATTCAGPTQSTTTENKSSSHKQIQTYPHVPRSFG